MRFIASLILALAPAFALPALAQDFSGRVGRIAHIEGSAAIYQDPDEGWEKAYVNSPVASENSVWTEPGSRAELRVGGTALRLDEATQVDIARLDDNELDAFVARGTVAVRVRHYDRNERLLFNTPHARFVVRADGRYRIDVDPDREESRLTVFAGQASVGSESGRVRVDAGKTVRVFGGSSPSYVVETAFTDPFDRWAMARDNNWTESRSVQYVSPNMTGYEDLDRYGEWREEPDVGALWYPTRVSSEWAPYRYGRWDYVRPWGWTWVDDAPWGYAPFHYGRWVYVGNRWGWTPGRRELRPAWAPALVAWIGGANFSVSLSGGSPAVGWYPLSPWERYQPWYNASPAYMNNINIIVRSDQPRRQGIDWRAVNRDRGVTVVNRETIIDRRPVQQALVQVRPEVVRQAQVTAPAAVLPPRNEMVQRRQTARTQAAKQDSPAPLPGPQTAPVQRGERAPPAARPDFRRAQAAPAAAPEPAKAAPPPPQRVTPPTAAAQEQARAQREAQQKQQPPARDAPKQDREALQQQAREAQQKARDEQAKGREAQQQKARDEQKGREAQQQQAREAQAKTRDEQAKAAQQQQERAQQQQRGQQQQQERAQQQQQQQRALQEQQERAQQQQKGRDEQAKAAQQQQQQAREAQAKARDEQAKAAQQQQQQAREAQAKARDEQAKAAQQQQQKARDEQAKAAQQQQQQRAQPPAQERAQPQRQERAKTRDEKDKEKDDEDKKARGR